MNIGILALQGDFQKHGSHLVRLGIQPYYIRTPQELESIDGLIIPGGESTVMAKLLVEFGLGAVLERRIQSGMPLFGTCAGLILMASEVAGRSQYTLNALDVTVERNSYGRQIESFESKIYSDLLGDIPMDGVFIRAPRIVRIGSSVEVLASFENDPILVRQGPNLAASFHPELTNNLKIHALFLEIVANRVEVLK